MPIDNESLSGLMSLDELMEQFMHRYVNSFIKWDLVQFFHGHPGQLYSTAQLAKVLNRPPDSLRSELAELAKDGFLAKRSSGKAACYRFALAAGKPTQQALCDLVNRFIDLCRTREGRLRIIYCVLKNGKPISG